ncbi:hypothetical protein VTK73DRAFT_3598 [Phialemonium thermophilum]|uniref:Uncharacterized protein n=1 Tax=Phialemonium thermophilum TaxID=223376 RepID=A0ABR3VHA0_9PEZI
MLVDASFGRGSSQRALRRYKWEEGRRYMGTFGPPQVGRMEGRVQVPALLGSSCRGAAGCVGRYSHTRCQLVTSLDPTGRSSKVRLACDSFSFLQASHDRLDTQQSTINNLRWTRKGTEAGAVSIIFTLGCMVVYEKQTYYFAKYMLSKCDLNPADNGSLSPQGFVALQSIAAVFFSVSPHQAESKVKKRKCGGIKNYRRDGPEGQSRLVGSTMCNAGLLSCLQRFLSFRKPAKVSMKKKREKKRKPKQVWRADGRDYIEI